MELSEQEQQAVGRICTGMFRFFFSADRHPLFAENQINFLGEDE